MGRNMFTYCSGKLADYMPPPYPNDEAARAGNGGYVDALVYRSILAERPVSVVCLLIYPLWSKLDTVEPTTSIPS
jgi:hypothetical protein